MNVKLSISKINKIIGVISLSSVFYMSVKYNQYKSNVPIISNNKLINIDNIDKKKKISNLDFIEILVYKYYYKNNLIEKYKIDKIIHKKKSEIYLFILAKINFIDYSEISTSINYPKDIDTINTYYIYKKYGISGIYDHYTYCDTSKNNTNDIEINYNDFAACFANSMKFISQNKNNNTIEMMTDGNSFHDVLANININMFHNMRINCNFLCFMFLFNIYVMIYYNIKLNKITDKIDFSSKYNIVKLINTKSRTAHAIAIINNENKTLIYDCNYGIFEIDKNNTEKFLNVLKMLYNNIYDLTLFYEFI